MRETLFRRILRRPAVWQGAAALAFIALVTLVLRRPLPASSWSWLAAFLVAVNLTVFIYYGLDKWQAQRGGRRVPEVVLHGLALAGGSPGAYLAMQAFRHKTIKARFRFIFWIIVGVQIVGAGWLAYHLWTEG
jgi:uncharacterized membrane protein YsdA (DUF1294 family)